MLFLNLNRKKTTPGDGFSLIEMMIVISIMSVMTSVILVQHSTFNSTVLLKNLAYDLSLSIREVQIAAISVKSSGSGFDAPHGIYFASITPQEYILFYDTNSNDMYDPGEADKTVYLNKNFKIKKLCRIKIGNQMCDFIGDLAIVFRRPDFDARLNTTTQNNITTTAKIFLSAVVDDTQAQVIMVNQSGYISVYNDK